MDKQRYMISDAATMVDVEAHVLRYWEDELELMVPRNEMGHRYYTEDNIEEFKEIKNLKEEGYQLKAIKMMIHNQNPETADKQALVNMTTTGVSQENKMAQFKEIMSEIMQEAMEENNKNLGKEIGNQVKEQVIKEMNYLMREQDEQEEERYKKLDEAIRSFAKKKKVKEKKKFFGKRVQLNPKSI